MREMKITQYLGAVCILGQDWYAGVTKESCKQVEAVFKDCKYHSVEEGRDVNDIINISIFGGDFLTINNNFSGIRSF